METKHTPTPWEVRHGASGWNVWHNGKLFAIAPTDTAANQIVRAVNSHAALVEALERSQVCIAELMQPHGDNANANSVFANNLRALKLAKES